MRDPVPIRSLSAIVAFAMCAPFAFAQNVPLPDIGSSAGEILSPEQEHQYGARMLYEMRRVDLVLEDALIADYVHALGYRLVALSERPEQEFTFFVVRSNDINAFAAPGGFVGLNVGLMHTAESESEVAAVLAHEVAHITQHKSDSDWITRQPPVDPSSPYALPNGRRRHRIASAGRQPGRKTVPGGPLYP